MAWWHWASQAVVCLWVGRVSHSVERASSSRGLGCSDRPVTLVSTAGLTLSPKPPEKDFNFSPWEARQKAAKYRKS